MKKKYAFIVLLTLFSCRNDILEHYERPDSVKGNTYTALEARGDSDFFLQACIQVGSAQLLGGHGLVTAFVPNDDAFRHYLQQQFGTDDLKTISHDDLKRIVSYHLVELSWSPTQFLGFATGDIEMGEGNGYTYKYKTFAEGRKEEYQIPFTDSKITVYGDRMYLPVLSSRIFETAKIADPEAEYRKFFPNIQWKGSEDQLYVANASILEAGIVTDNGYIYIIDSVITPLKTIDQELKSDMNYNYFSSIVDKFSIFEYDEDISDNYGEGDSLFLHWHFKAPMSGSELTEFASQLTYHDEEGTSFEKACRYAITCLAPETSELKSFFDGFFQKYKETYDPSGNQELYDILPANTLYHFMKAHSYDKRDIVLPTTLAEEGIVGNNGEIFTVPSSNLNSSVLCGNGVLYKIVSPLESRVFTHLPRPLFENTEFEFMAHAINTLNVYQQLCDDNNRFTFFIMDDETVVEEFDYSLDKSIENFGEYTLKSGKNLLSTANAFNFVLSHLYVGDLLDNEDIAGRRQYYLRQGNSGMTHNSHYFYTFDGHFYDETHYNAEGSLGPIGIIDDEYETNNGYVYRIEEKFKRLGQVEAYADNQDYISSRLSLSTSSKWTDLSIFKQLLESSGLFRTAQFPFVQNFILFAPNDEVMQKGLDAGKIPIIDTIYDVDGSTIKLLPNTVDTVGVANFLKLYFIPLTTNNWKSYILPGLDQDGYVQTEAFTRTAITSYPFTHQENAKQIDITWDPNFSENDENGIPLIGEVIQFKIGDNIISTYPAELPLFARNGLLYVATGYIDADDYVEFGVPAPAVP